MKVVRQARLELSGGSTPDQLRPPPGTAVTVVCPYTGLPQISTQPKNSGDELEQIMFPTENVRLLCKSAAFALWT